MLLAVAALPWIYASPWHVALLNQSSSGTVRSKNGTSVASSGEGLPAGPTIGQITLGSDENTYINEEFGLSFRYPSTFRLVEGYPSAAPPITEPSTNTPYSIVLLKSATDRYPFIEIDVLPKNAWEGVIATIKRQDYPYYPFPSGADGESVALSGGMAYRYVDGGSPYIYYFQHPTLQYMFTFRPWNPLADVPSLEVFYHILASIGFIKIIRVAMFGFTAVH